MLETDKSLPQTQKVQLAQSVEQLKIVLELLDTESNPIILEKLFGDNYATESIAQYRATTKKIADKLTTFAQKIGFSALKAACFDQYHQEPIKKSEIYPNVYFPLCPKNSSVSNSQKQCRRSNVVLSCQTCF